MTDDKSDTSGDNLEDKNKAARNITPHQFSQMEDEVYKYWPTAHLIPTNKDSTSFFDYAESHVGKSPVNQTENRRNEFREYLKKKVAGLLGDEVANSVYKQLETNHSISTAQHYVTLTPRTLNPSLQTSLAYFGRTEPDRQNIIVLGCAGISFNNPWSARGHYFHSLTNNQIIENYIAFFGRAKDPHPIIFTPAYEKDSQKSIQKLLLHYRSEKLIKKREFNHVREFVDEVLFTSHVLSQKNYIDQVTITNFHVWRRIFQSYEGNVPNFIFLSQEKIASELIKEFHLKNETLLHKFLFDPAWHELILKYFDGIMCAFSLERNYGTFHFWAMRNNGRDRIQLFLNNGILESPDKSVQIPLTPETIGEAISKNELLPSTMLTFIILGMYYGFSLSGGLDQPTYLTQTKEAYLKLLHDLEMTDEIKNVEPVITDNIVITRPTLAFLEDSKASRTPATALDLILYGDIHSWLQILEASKHISLSEMFYRLYPELYRDYCKHSNKDQELLQITEQQVEKFTGIDKKIPPWAILKEN